MGCIRLTQCAQADVMRGIQAFYSCLSNRQILFWIQDGKPWVRSNGILNGSVVWVWRWFLPTEKFFLQHLRAKHTETVYIWAQGTSIHFNNSVSGSADLGLEWPPRCYTRFWLHCLLVCGSSRVPFVVLSGCYLRRSVSLQKVTTWNHCGGFSRS